MGLGANKDFGSRQTTQVNRVTDPTDAVTQLLAQNEQLKQQNGVLQGQNQQWAEKDRKSQAEMKELAQFRQIINTPIEKFTLEIYDAELFRILRGRMIQMFGQGGQMDAEGRWAQGVVNDRLQLILRQLMYVGLQRWPQVKAQVDEIIKVQGLRK